MTAPSSDIAFSPAVRAVQKRRGSRKGYERMEAKGGFRTTIDANLAQFIASMRSFYIATASKDGQPYVQHRGGPPGFLHVVDEKTLAFANFSGNRQYISTSNLAENPHAFVFLMDYENGRCTFPDRHSCGSGLRPLPTTPTMIAGSSANGRLRLAARIGGLATTRARATTKLRSLV